MNLGFEIIDGIVYVDKSLYRASQKEDNNISKLVGSPCVDLFKTGPMITSGVESVTINYHYADEVCVNMDPYEFVTELRDNYATKVRGHLVVDLGDHKPVDMVINSY